MQSDDADGSHGKQSPEPRNLTTPPPLLTGSPEVEEGYYDLEEHERNQSWVALRAHNYEFSLWSRALTLYRRAMLGTWHFQNAEPGTVELTSLGLRMQLLGLGVCAAKSSFDDLIAGYYSQAFAGIRHLLETFVQCMYVDFHPDQALLWYEQEGGVAAQVDPPSMKTMCQALKAEPTLSGTNVRLLLDKVYNSWQLMSKGAHPSGVGILQTRQPDTGMGLIGATYREDLCLAGLDHGLFVLGSLIPRALRMTKPTIGAWSDEWNQLKDEIGAWREENKASLLASEGTIPEERPISEVPRPVPGVISDEVKRCYNLIRLRQEEMNRLQR